MVKRLGTIALLLLTVLASGQKERPAHFFDVTTVDQTTILFSCENAKDTVEIRVISTVSVGVHCRNN